MVQSKTASVTQPFHASAVAVGTKGLLILGPSGSGKSSLALRLIAFGARLVSDDQVLVAPGSDAPIASAPANLRGLIEARHVGILRLAYQDSTPIHLIVDLAKVETDRLPAQHSRLLAGLAVPVIGGSRLDCLAPALFCYLSGNREA